MKASNVYGKLASVKVYSLEVSAVGVKVRGEAQLATIVTVKDIVYSVDVTG